ncbi:lipopolysaccharide export system permease protein [Robiginitalea myxolifaciens]|uniref:Lipopolysaccharide export system permease protein n=2 Tax=Robiginitalea myxolifaciens TaxID=400055 RepID=A0A1I6H0I6_9FLAO|nr:lipopolysaccharide export system permease protein [Robiginitalea myxolifaciens]
MFIFIFQTIWLFIDDLAGKGLDLIIIGKFLFYLMPNLTEKVLPLTVLLSSILTFGAFAENYEFAAMKASGISLQRSMAPLIVFVSLLGILTFYFANTVIPISEQKIYNLRRNIASLKPAAAITEGVFSDFEGRSIKVERKYGENDRFLDNIIIHEKSRLQKNVTVIKAATGELISSEGSDIIQLLLKDGYYYHDLVNKSGTTDRTFPYAKADFETYVMNIALPDNMEDIEADRNVETDKMKNVSRLLVDIDSIRDHNLELATNFSRSISNRVGAFPLSEETTPVDSLQRDSTGRALEGMKVSLDSTKAASKPTVAQRAPNAANSNFGQANQQRPGQANRQRPGPARQSAKREVSKVGKPQSLSMEDPNPHREVYPDSLLTGFKTFEQGQLLDNARNSVRNLLNTVQGKRDELELSYKRYNVHILSLHKKFALALSCIVLFFVGAPLGAIIRKGGLGLPMVVAIVLFLAYYFFGVFSGNYAKEGNIHPALGAWLPTMIMLPLGIWLTRRATADQGLMSFGHFIDWFRERFSRKNKAKAAK